MRAVLRDPRIGRLFAVAALAASVAALAGCPPGVPNYDYAKEPDPRNKEIVLGAGDVIGVNVWENANLNTEATIRPDGTITMPLIGDVKAAGETPTMLRNRIKTQIAQFVKNTEVTIAVKAWKSYRFTIQGEVSRAGVYSAEQFLTVADALALAGGLTRFAKRNEIKLTRKDNKTGEVRYIPLDYESLASGKRPDMNIYVLAGDTIWVP
jgi:polysaccharide biosynthesis/export protein